MFRLLTVILLSTAYFSATKAQTDSQLPVPQTVDSSKYAKPEWIDLISPSTSTNKLVSACSTISLASKDNIGHLKTRRFNEAVAKEIVAMVDSLSSGCDMMVKEIKVKGYGAPIGNLRRNTVQGEMRAFELRNHLVSSPKLAAQTVEVSWITEDWGSIAILVDATNMPLRAATLDVIRSVDVSSGREAQLQMLGSGKPYRYMQRNIFPKVCRIEYSVTLEDITDDKLRHERFLTENGSMGKLSVANLTAQASTYGKTTREYAELLYLAVRLHPVDPVARINAAGAAHLHGELDKAAELLSGLESDNRSYANLGILHLLRGERQKAATYLKMADKEIDY